MQHANLFPVVRDVDALATAKSKEQLKASWTRIWRLPGLARGAQRFKDREMFRVDMRHILGHAVEFWEFAEELTDLAEVVVDAAYRLCFEELRGQFGSPLLPDGNPPHWRSWRWQVRRRELVCVGH